MIPTMNPVIRNTVKTALAAVDGAMLSLARAQESLTLALSAIEAAPDVPDVQSDAKPTYVLMKGRKQIVAGDKVSIRGRSYTIYSLDFPYAKVGHDMYATADELKAKWVEMSAKTPRLVCLKTGCTLGVGQIVSYDGYVCRIKVVNLATRLVDVVRGTSGSILYRWLTAEDIGARWED